MGRLNRVKSAARENWRRVTERGFEIARLEHPRFTGYVTKLGLKHINLH